MPARFVWSGRDPPPVKPFARGPQSSLAHAQVLLHLLRCDAPPRLASRLSSSLNLFARRYTYFGALAPLGAGLWYALSVLLNQRFKASPYRKQPFRK